MFNVFAFRFFFLYCLFRSSTVYSLMPIFGDNLGKKITMLNYFLYFLHLL